MAKRQIIKIDEEKCNGCGLCTQACAEGALAVIDGKARLVSEIYCDGLGACLGECPQGALTIETREAEEFDEAAVEAHLAEPEPCNCPSMAFAPQPAMHTGCPGSRVRVFEETDTPSPQPSPSGGGNREPSALRQWPVQLALVPVDAPFLQGAELLIAADCVPVAYAGFHQDLLACRALVVGCPKLDDVASYQLKLTEMLRHSDIRKVTVARMEVPCCAGMVAAARRAVMASGRDIPFEEIVIGVKGERLA